MLLLYYFEHSSFKKYFFNFIFCFILIFSSFILQEFVYTKFYIVSYSFIFCRFWQFIAGIVSYLLREMNELENRKKENFDGTKGNFLRDF